MTGKDNIDHNFTEKKRKIECEKGRKTIKSK